MPAGTEIALMLSIIFISTMARSTFGFGDALIAMPLLALVVPVSTATPLIALIAVIISTSILIRNWRLAKAPGALPLIIFSIIGIPVGLIYLREAAEDVVKIVLASIIILFSIYKLANPKLLTIKNEKLSFAFGLLAGMLGGAYNTNGPPIIIYGTLRGWEPDRFRAILQAIFLPTNIFIVIGHGIAGFWSQTVIFSFLFALPVVIIGIFLGGRLNKRIPAEKFTKYIYIFLIIIGVVLLVNTVA